MTERLFTSAADPGELAERDGYRQISPWAVAVAATGLLSALAYLHPLVWLLPAGSTLLGLYALGDIARADPPRGGRRFAWFGLALSVLCGVSAPARWFAVEAELVRRGAAVGELWLTAFARNQPDVAFGLTRPPTAARPPLDTPLEKLLENEAYRRGYESFLKRQLIALLLKHRDNLKFNRAGSTEWKADLNADFIVVNYELVSPEELVAEVPVIRLLLKRVVAPETREELWQVVEFVVVRAADEPIPR